MGEREHMVGKGRWNHKYCTKLISENRGAGWDHVYVNESVYHILNILSQAECTTHYFFVSFLHN